MMLNSVLRSILSTHDSLILSVFTNQYLRFFGGLNLYPPVTTTLPYSPPSALSRFSTRPTFVLSAASNKRTIT